MTFFPRLATVPYTITPQKYAHSADVCISNFAHQLPATTTRTFTVTSHCGPLCATRFWKQHNTHIIMQRTRMWHHAPRPIRHTESHTAPLRKTITPQKTLPPQNKDAEKPHRLVLTNFFRPKSTSISADWLMRFGRNATPFRRKKNA